MVIKQEKAVAEAKAQVKLMGALAKARARARARVEGELAAKSSEVSGLNQDVTAYAERLRETREEAMDREEAIDREETNGHWQMAWD